MFCPLFSLLFFLLKLRKIHHIVMIAHFFREQKSIGFIFVVVVVVVVVCRHIISTCCMCTMYVFMSMKLQTKIQCKKNMKLKFQLQVPLPATLRIFPLFTKHFRYIKWRNPHLYKRYVRFM